MPSKHEIKFGFQSDDIKNKLEEKARSAGLTLNQYARVIILNTLIKGGEMSR